MLNWTFDPDFYNFCNFVPKAAPAAFDQPVTIEQTWSVCKNYMRVCTQARKLKVFCCQK